jgi:hypothetical protein
MDREKKKKKPAAAAAPPPHSPGLDETLRWRWLGMRMGAFAELGARHQSYATL